MAVLSSNSDITIKLKINFDWLPFAVVKLWAIAPLNPPLQTPAQLRSCCQRFLDKPSLCPDAPTHQIAPMPAAGGPDLLILEAR